MSRKRQPARLRLEPAEFQADGSLKRAAVWYVVDGRTRRSTGCGESDIAGAEKALADYNAAKHAAAPAVRDKAAEATKIADVIAHYATVHGASVANPRELARRLGRLLEWWRAKTLDEVNRTECQRYAAFVGSDQSARRDLEDFRAAVNRYASDGLCRDEVKVWTPKKADPRGEFMTRDEIARLLWHCITKRGKQGNKVTTARTIRHLAPFILFAVCTGTRSSRVWQASFVQEEGRPWIDVENGIYYRAAPGERVSATKRAGTIVLPRRLMLHIRRWAKNRTYLCEYHGRPADPKKGLARAMTDVFGEGHGFKRHTLRHTAATWLMWAGRDPREIADYLSMSEKLLRDVYGHHHPDANKDVGDAFDHDAGRRKKRA